MLFGAVFAFLLYFPQAGFCGNLHKPTCAVLNFHPDAASTEHYESRYITNRYSTLLGQLKLYDVLSPAKVHEKLMDQKWQMIDTCNDKKCALEAGRILGVDFIIYGVLGHIGKMYSMDTTLLDVKNATVVNTAVTDFEGNRDEFAKQAPPRNIQALLGIKTIPPEWASLLSESTPMTEAVEASPQPAEKAFHIGPRVGLGFGDDGLQIGIGLEAMHKNFSFKVLGNDKGFAGALSYHLHPEGNTPYASLVGAYYEDTPHNHEIGVIYGLLVGYRIYLHEKLDLCVGIGVGYDDWDQKRPNTIGIKESGSKAMLLGEFSIGYLF